MTVLVTIPTDSYPTAEANRIFEEVVRALGGEGKTHLSLYDDDLYESEVSDGEVAMGEFDLPEPIDYEAYEERKQELEEKYEDITIQLEAEDGEFVHEEVGANV